MTTETTTPDTPTTWTREVGRLNYRGDVVDAVLASPIMGPTATGERVTAYEATYDAATDKTLVLFRYTTTDDVEAMAVGGGHRG